MTETPATANSRTQGRRTVTSASSRLRRSRRDTETIGFSTEISRQNTRDIDNHDVPDDELREKRRQKLDRPKVMQKMYEKACNRHRVVPVRLYWEAPDSVEVILPNYNLGSYGVQALSIPLMLHESITRLDLSGNDMGASGITALVEALRDNTSLTYLNLAENKLQSAGANALKEFLREHPALHTLSVSGNGFKDDDSIMFAQVMKENQRLKHVDFSHNEFAETAGIQFRYVLSDTENLESFDISWNHLRRKGAMDLLAGVKKNYGLRVLDVSFNGFAAEGAAVMANVLKKNRTLQEVDMRHNRLNDADVINIATKMDANDSLKVLKLGDNHFTQVGALALLTVLLNPDNVVALEELDLGNTCVTEEFDFIANELKTSRQNLTIKYGRVLNMKKKVFKKDISCENSGKNIEKANTFPNMTTTTGNDGSVLNSTHSNQPNTNVTRETDGGTLETETINENMNTISADENKNHFRSELSRSKEKNVDSFAKTSEDQEKDTQLSKDENKNLKGEEKSRTGSITSHASSVDPKNLFVLQRQSFIEKKS